MKPTICPFLGILDDPETHHAFPSMRNCCQRARPIEPVSLEHQSSHCLCLDYVHCAMLSRSPGAALPVDLQVPQSSGKRSVIGVGITILIVMILILVGWRQSWLLARSAAPTPMMTELPSATITLATPISTSRIAIPNVVTNPQNTSTVSPSHIPSVTATQTPVAYPTNIGENTKTTVPSATMTVCGPPSGWVIYIVQPNDSLSHLGQKFGVTVADLQEANCMGIEVTIYSGQKLYVPNVPVLTVPVYPTRTPTESVSPTEEYEVSTNTPEPVSTDTPFPTDTPQLTDTPLPTSTTHPTNTLPHLHCQQIQPHRYFNPTT